MKSKIILGCSISLIVLTLLFQNCGAFQTSSTNVEPSQETMAPNSSTEDFGLPISFGLKSSSLFRGEKIHLKLAKQDLSFPNSFKISSIDKNAKAGIDFVKFDQDLKFDSDSVSMIIQTLIPDPFAEDRKFSIRVDYTDASGKAAFVEKEILIKSKFEKTKYKGLKGTTYRMCGLGYDDEVYCWGAQGSRAGDVGQQPFKIKLPRNLKIDFTSLKMNSDMACFQPMNVNQVYCATFLPIGLLNFRTDGLNSDRQLTDADLFAENVSQFVLSERSVYFLDQSQVLFVTDINHLIRNLSGDKKIAKIFAYGYAGVLAAKSTGGYEVYYGSSLSTSPLPPSVVTLDYRTIADSNIFYLFTKNKKMIYTYYLDSETNRIKDIPEDFATSTTADGGCHISINGNFICGSPLQSVFNLEQKGYLPNSIVSRSFPEYCALELNGDLKCIFKYGNGYQMTGSFAKNTRYYSYMDISETLFNNLSTNQFSRPLDDPQFQIFDYIKDCSFYENSILACFGKKVFGDEKIKPETVRVNIDTFEVLDQYSHKWSNPFIHPIIVAETTSGRKLAYGLPMVTNNTEPQQVYKLVPGQILD